MPKLKTKSTAKKRFRLTASGAVKRASASRGHNMRHRTQRMLRNTRGMCIMHPTDAKRVCDYYFHV